MSVRNLKASTSDMAILSTSYTTESTNPMQDFLLFPRLPIELQDKVWSFAIPNQRYLEILLRCGIPTNTQNSNPRYLGCTLANKSADVTPILRACKRSRAIALKKLPNHLPSENQDIELRFSAEKDVIYITHRSFSKLPEGESIEDRFSNFQTGSIHTRNPPLSFPDPTVVPAELLKARNLAYRMNGYTRQIIPSLCTLKTPGVSWLEYFTDLGTLKIIIKRKESDDAVDVFLGELKVRMRRDGGYKVPEIKIVDRKLRDVRRFVGKVEGVVGR